MPVEVTMPKLTDSMEEGRIVEWKVKPGDEVREGDVIAEVETDKAVMELESFWNGTVSEILQGDGDVVAVGGVIARIAETGEEAATPRGEPSDEEESGPEKSREESQEEGDARDEVPEQGQPEEEERAEGQGSREESAESHPGEPRAESGGRPRSAEEERRRTGEGKGVAEGGRGETPGEEIPIPGGHLRAEGRKGGQDRVSGREPGSTGVRASPRARKIAKERGLELESVHGTGPDGRITVEDVEQSAGGEPSGEPEAAKRPRGGEQGRRVEPAARTLAEKRGVDLEGLQGTGVGGRVTVDDVLSAASRSRKPQGESRAAGPERADEELPEIAFDEGEAEVEEVSFYQKAAIRRVVASKHVIPHFYLTKTVDAEALLSRKEAEKSEATLTHLLMRACARALEKFPEANRSYDRGRWIRWKVVHLGLAVQTDAGLVVAVLRNVHGKDLPWIVENTRELVERARAGKLKQKERVNPTFTISNLGAFDVESFSAIINPPSALTLAVGSVVPTPVVRDGEVVPGNLLHLTLSCDHRVVDGVLAARFLGEVKTQLEAAKDL